MSQQIYTVHAYRWGDRELHSYSVGVYPKKHAALQAAEAETEYRGGKYECEVIEWVIGRLSNVAHRPEGKVILPLPGNTLRGRKPARNPQKSKASF